MNRSTSGGAGTLREGLVTKLYLGESQEMPNTIKSKSSSHVLS